MSGVAQLGVPLFWPDIGRGSAFSSEEIIKLNQIIPLIKERLPIIEPKVQYNGGSFYNRYAELSKPHAIYQEGTYFISDEEERYLFEKTMIVFAEQTFICIEKNNLVYVPESKEILHKVALSNNLQKALFLQLLYQDETQASSDAAAATEEEIPIKVHTDITYLYDEIQLTNETLTKNIIKKNLTYLESWYTYAQECTQTYCHQEYERQFYILVSDPRKKWHLILNLIDREGIYHGTNAILFFKRLIQTCRAYAAMRVVQLKTDQPLDLTTSIPFRAESFHGSLTPHNISYRIDQQNPKIHFSNWLESLKTIPNSNPGWRAPEHCQPEIEKDVSALETSLVLASKADTWGLGLTIGTLLQGKFLKVCENPRYLLPHFRFIKSNIHYYADKDVVDDSQLSSISQQEINEEIDGILGRLYHELSIELAIEKEKIPPQIREVKKEKLQSNITRETIGLWSFVKQCLVVDPNQRKTLLQLNN